MKSIGIMSTMTETTLAIKVDVDTLVGTRDGVPRLRDIFEARGVKASFYLSLGPDNSGRAVFRVFTRPGFLAKQLRSKAPSAFGLKTLLMGTLLPSPIIGDGQEPIVRELIDAGHDVGLHAWDHVSWHDRLWKWDDVRVREELTRGLEAFERIAGVRPQGFAAPAWRINPAAVEVLEAAGLTYMSATRGRAPYMPRLDGKAYGLLEIPTTLPTADEVLGRGGIGPDDLPDFFLERVASPGLHVLTIHAEMEGRVLAAPFERLLDRALDKGIRCISLAEVAGEILDRRPSPAEYDVIRAELPGRAGKVSCQAP